MANPRHRKVREEHQEYGFPRWEVDERDCQKHREQYGQFNSHDDSIMWQVPAVTSQQFRVHFV